LFKRDERVRFVVELGDQGAAISYTDRSFLTLSPENHISRPSVTL
jgi:hypothetical protein